jgi:hypothetical protein
VCASGTCALRPWRAAEEDNRQEIEPNSTTGHLLADLARRSTVRGPTILAVGAARRPHNALIELAESAYDTILPMRSAVLLAAGSASNLRRSLALNGHHVRKFRFRQSNLVPTVPQLRYIPQEVFQFFEQSRHAGVLL